MIQPFGVILAFGVLVDECIKKQRSYNLLNIGDGGVVNTQTRTHLGCYHSLYHRAEDVGVDTFPIILAALQHQESGSEAQHRDRGLLTEKSAIDIREPTDNIGHTAALLGVVGCGHRLKQLPDELGKVAAVILGTGLQCVGKQVDFGEQTRVLGKVTEQQTRHEEVKGVDLPLVMHIVITAYIVIDTSHHLSRFHISLSLLGILHLLDTCQRFEKLEIAPQQVYRIAVYIILLGVPTQDVHAVADHIEPRLLLDNRRIGS